MKTKLISLSTAAFVLLIAGLAIIWSCKKKDSTNISTPPLQIGAGISDTTTGGTIKGTMQGGKTYTIKRDIFVNKGDTLLLQSNVKLCMGAGTSIFVKGTLISLGTQTNPNWITVCGVTKTDNTSSNPASDPAFAGKWCGINCDDSAKLLVLKWTHVEFGGSTFSASQAGAIANMPANSYDVFFQNPSGVFVMEDCWLYGSIDDAVRVIGGKIHVMRNTFEKCGLTGGEGINIKSGTVGDVAYNLFVGIATNGPKASNKGGSTIQTNVNFYNNTMVNCGYRRVATGRGGSINYEEGSRGYAYNNLIVDCKFGVRVVKTPPADTMNMHYGNNYNYVDSLSLANQIYPVGYITHPQSTDIPAISFLPTGYSIGQVYDGSSVVGKNNPAFTGYSLPNSQFRNTNYVGSANFRLSSGSPAIGKGYTGFSALAPVSLNANYGATEVTAPGSDIGCYQSNGKGNQH